MCARGWRGVLIEPNPEEYKKIPAERPNSISVNAAICDRKQDVHFVGRMAKDNKLKSAGANPPPYEEKFACSCTGLVLRATRALIVWVQLY